MGSHSATVTRLTTPQRTPRASEQTRDCPAARQHSIEHMRAAPGAGALPRLVSPIPAFAPEERSAGASLHASVAFPLQRTRAVGDAHDPLELEGDRIADRSRGISSE